MTTAGPDPDGDIVLRRAFGWGVLFIGDAEADIVEVEPDSVITWGREDQTVAVLVRHAQDVDDEVLDALHDDDEVPDAEVAVSVHWGPLVDGKPVDEGVIAVHSGRVSVGDADHENSFSVAPGRWHVQIGLEPIQHAERIDVWLSRAD